MRQPMRQPLHSHSSERLSGVDAEAMLHLDEVFSAEIYARDGIVVHRKGAREGSFETMGFKWRFLSHFLFAIEKKVQTFP